MNVIDVHLATIAVKEYREDSAVGGVNYYNTEIMADTLEKFVVQEARLLALRDKLLEWAAAEGVTPDGNYYIDTEEVASAHGHLQAAQELEKVLS